MSFGEAITDLATQSLDPLHGTAKSWQRVPLAEVVDILNGYPWPSSGFSVDEGQPVVRIRNVSEGRTSTFYRGDIVDGFWVFAGDLLVGMDGDFNRNVWNGPNALLNQRVCKLTVQERLYDKRFLFHVLPGYLRLINKHTSSVTVKHLSSKTLGEIPLPLPPRAEQERIAVKLDVLNAKSARARTELARIETLVSRYKQAVLTKAFVGNSTPRRLGELVARIKAGKNLRCEERPPHPHERGVVKVSAVTWGEFRADQSKTLPPDFKPDEDTRIKTGDFLFSRANTIDLVGAVVIVADVPDNLYLSDKILRLEFTEPIDSWMLWYLRSPMGREALMNISSGNQMSMRNIGQKSLLSLSIPYAPAHLRNDITRRIESAFSKIDRLAGEARLALKLVSKLDEAILGKAFRGELVPQDENDEPASVLLEKIKRTRVDQPPRVRLKTPAKPRKVRSLANTIFEALSQSDDWLSSQELFERCGVRDGSSTEDVEAVYRQLLELERQKKIEIEEVADPSTGIKQGDRVRLRR